MLRFDEGDQVFGLLTVIGPAGLFQSLGKGSQPMRAEGGARRFEGVGRDSYGVVLLSLQGLSQLRDLGLGAGWMMAGACQMVAQRQIRNSELTICSLRVGCWNDQGYLASITLRSPPRAANSPVTFACTGRQAFTTSCRMRLIAFS